MEPFLPFFVGTNRVETWSELLLSSPSFSSAPVNGFRTLLSSSSPREEESRVYILFSSFFTRHSFSSVIFSREYRVDLSRWLVPLAPFFSLLRLKFLLEFSEIPFRSLPILRYRKILLLQIHLSRRIPDDWSRIERRGLDLLILSLFRNPFPGWIESGDDVESRKRVGRKWRHQKFHADRWFPLCERDTWYTRDTRPVYVSRGGEKLARWEEPRLDRGIDSSSDYPRSIIDNNLFRLIIRSREVIKLCAKTIFLSFVSKFL